jgi:hypothetical protein
VYGQTSLDLPATFIAATSARCAPCARGEFCPAGTYEGAAADADAQAASRACPPGYFCPGAAAAQECDAGAYCVEGSSAQHTCNYSELFVKDPLAKIPTQEPTVLERIYLQGDPLGGNYCPAGADTPLTKCALHPLHAWRLDCFKPSSR